MSGCPLEMRLPAKVNRLAPSFGGGARFIPEKYKQSIVGIYTLYSKKESRNIAALRLPVLMVHSTRSRGYWKSFGLQTS